MAGLYIQTNSVISSPSRIMTHLITSTFVLWLKGASRAKLLTNDNAWLLTLTSGASFTKHAKLHWIKILCGGVTHPDVQSGYEWSFQAFNRESQSWQTWGTHWEYLLGQSASLHLHQHAYYNSSPWAYWFLNTSLSMSNISLIGISRQA